MEENFCNASLWSNCNNVFYLMLYFPLLYRLVFYLTLKSSLHKFFSLLLHPFFSPFLQDHYAIRSFERGISAQNAGVFAWEIVPVCFLIPFQAGESSQSMVSSCYHLIILLCRLKFLGEEGSLP